MKKEKGNKDTKNVKDHKPHSNKQPPFFTSTSAIGNNCKGSKIEDKKTEIQKDNKNEIIKEIQKDINHSAMGTEDMLLFVELYENMNKGDDIKALAICKLRIELIFITYL